MDKYSLMKFLFILLFSGFTCISTIAQVKQVYFSIGRNFLNATPIDDGAYSMSPDSFNNQEGNRELCKSAPYTHYHAAQHLLVSFLANTNRKMKV